MKTKKNLITLLCILYGCFIYGQVASLSPAQWLELHKEEIKKTNFIIQGTVIKQGMPGGVWTYNIIQIAKIYKGSPQINIGTIKVYVYRPTSEGGGWLVKGSTYILLCNSTNVPTPNDTISTTNNIKLTNYGCDGPIQLLGNNKVEWSYDKQFKTVSDIDTFFKENGLKVQEEVQEQ